MTGRREELSARDSTHLKERVIAARHEVARQLDVVVEAKKESKA